MDTVIIQWRVNNNQFSLPLRYNKFTKGDGNYWAWCKSNGAPSFFDFRDMDDIEFNVDLQIIYIYDDYNSLIYPTTKTVINNQNNYSNQTNKYYGNNYKSKIKPKKINADNDDYIPNATSIDDDYKDTDTTSNVKTPSITQSRTSNANEHDDLLKKIRELEAYNAKLKQQMAQPSTNNNNGNSAESSDTPDHPPPKYSPLDPNKTDLERQQELEQAQREELGIRIHYTQYIGILSYLYIT